MTETIISLRSSCRLVSFEIRNVKMMYRLENDYQISEKSGVFEYFAGGEATVVQAIQKACLYGEKQSPFNTF